MANKELLKRLVENALDFLQRSLDDFKDRPKYSVIHFYAGIELLLKARLMAEHWSLVVSKRQDADWRRFRSGDFISVSLDEAADRLDKVVLSGLLPNEIEIFRGVARHRNRMVHFFHDAAVGKPSDDVLRDVAREQLTAWYVLDRLLTDRWKEVFSPWAKILDRIGKRLREHDQYLQVTFDYLRPEIQKRSAEGVSFRECPSCGFASLELEDEVGRLFNGRCLVCTFHERCLSIECPECSSTIVFRGSGFGECESCDKKFEPRDLVELIDSGEKGTKDYFESNMPAHCVSCDGYETVVAHGGKYVCADCFSIYGEDDLHQCDWCGDQNAGELEDSSWSGCVACEGQAGHLASKND